MNEGTGAIRRHINNPDRWNRIRGTLRGYFSMDAQELMKEANMSTFSNLDILPPVERRLEVRPYDDKMTDKEKLKY